MTARHWLRERAYAVAAAVHTEADYFTVLQSLGIKVKTRLGPESGDVIGYSLAAPGDTNSAGEPIWYGGSKLAPDLSINRLRGRLPDQEVTDRPRFAADPAEPWQHTITAIQTAHFALDSDDHAAAQGQLAAFSDVLYNIASATPGPHRAEATRSRHSVQPRPPIRHPRGPPSSPRPTPSRQGNSPTPPTDPADSPSPCTSPPCT